MSITDEVKNLSHIRWQKQPLCTYFLSFAAIYLIKCSRKRYEETGTYSNFLCLLHFSSVSYEVPKFLKWFYHCLLPLLRAEMYWFLTLQAATINLIPPYGYRKIPFINMFTLLFQLYFINFYTKRKMSNIIIIRKLKFKQDSSAPSTSTKPFDFGKNCEQNIPWGHREGRWKHPVMW